MDSRHLPGTAPEAWARPWLRAGQQAGPNNQLQPLCLHSQLSPSLLLPTHPHFCLSPGNSCGLQCGIPDWQPGHPSPPAPSVQQMHGERQGKITFRLQLPQKPLAARKAKAVRRGAEDPSHRRRQRPGPTGWVPTKPNDSDPNQGSGSNGEEGTKAKTPSTTAGLSFPCNMEKCKRKLHTPQTTT